MENEKVYEVLDIPENEVNVIEAYFDQVTINMKCGKVYTQAELILIAHDMNVCVSAKMLFVFCIGNWISENCYIAGENEV